MAEWRKEIAAEPVWEGDRPQDIAQFFGLVHTRSPVGFGFVLVTSAGFRPVAHLCLGWTAGDHSRGADLSL